MIAMPPAIPATATATAPVAPVQQPYLQQQLQQQMAPVVVTTAPAVVQRVSIDHAPARSDLLADTEDWTWAELRDYVVSEITERFGPFPRDSRKEYGIFSRFINQYGSDAIAVAKFAFGPTCDGWWGRAPISVNRFCKGSDPYFVQPILERLADTVPASA